MKIFTYTFDTEHVFHSSTVKSDPSDAIPYWVERDVTDLTYRSSTGIILVEYKLLKFDKSKYPIGTMFNYDGTIALAPQSSFCPWVSYQLIDTAYYNGKTYRLLTIEDALECYQELSLMLNNERMEEVLATV